MGCGSSGSAKVVPTDKETNDSNHVTDSNATSQKYPPPEAFVIPLETEGDSSLIKKHPPKRLQRLFADSPSATLTLEDLEAKLAGAELRRNQFLQQRSNNLKSTDENISQENLMNVKNDEVDSDNDVQISKL